MKEVVMNTVNIHEYWIRVIDRFSCLYSISHFDSISNLRIS